MSNTPFNLAKQYIAGGVNSPVRAFQSVGGDPIFIQKAQGAYLWDVQNKQYIDYVGSWGAMILGHAHSAVLEQIIKSANNGVSFGAPTEVETKLAKKICELVPHLEKVRMVNSGTEATMSAIRLARGYTQRNRIIKFTGCYHGHSDSLLVKAGSGALTLGVPTSPGVPEQLAQLTHTLAYNDLEAVKTCFSQYGEEIAAIIVEPIAGNMNFIEPKKGFLEGLRTLCDEYNSLLIIDEVMTGFRVGLGGAQAHYGIQADISCFGKVIGGGLPVGAFAGKNEIMSQLAPEGAIYQAGTLSGNPVAMAAGLKTLELISQPQFFENLTVKVKSLLLGLKRAAESHGIPLQVKGVGGMFGIFFTAEKDVHSYEQATSCNLAQFQAFFHGMLSRGVYMAPSMFEAGFVSAAHSENDIADTIAIASEVFESMKRG